MESKRRVYSGVERLLGSPMPRKIGTSIAWLCWERGFSFVVQFTVGLWVIHYLGAPGYGDLSYCLSIAALAAMVVGPGIDQNALRDLAARPEDARGILGMTLLARLLSAGLAMTVLLGASLIFLADEPPLALALLPLALTPAANAAGAAAALWFSARLEMGYLVVTRNAAMSISAGYRVALILHGASMQWFAGAALVEAVAAGIFVVGFFRRRAGYWPWARRTDWARVLPLLRRSWPLMLAGFAVFLNIQIDIVMLRHLAGSEETGIYAAAVRLSEAPYFLVGVVVSSIVPYLVGLRQADWALYEGRIRHLFRLLLAGGLAVAGSVALMSESLTDLFLGPTLAASAPILRVHAWAMLAVSAGCLSNALLINEGAQKATLYVSIAAATVNIMLNLALIPAFGGIGAACATLVSYAVASTFALPLFGEQARWAFRLQAEAVFSQWLIAMVLGPRISSRSQDALDERA